MTFASAVSASDAIASQSAAEWSQPDGAAGPSDAASSANVAGRAHLQATLDRMTSPELPDEDTGYVRVDNSSDCRMLWWLYGAQRAARREGAPLVLWLEGGPGSSGWLSDLGQIGPVDAERHERPDSWAVHANLLFVDSPVGVGFSFCGRAAGLRTSMRQVVQDLRATLAAVLAHHPRLRRHAARRRSNPGASGGPRLACCSRFVVGPVCVGTAARCGSSGRAGELSRRCAWPSTC